MNGLLGAFVVILIASVPAAAHADANKPPSGKDQYNINVQMDPALSAKEEKYKTAHDALSAAQKSTLKSIEEAAAQAELPYHELVAKTLTTKTCHEKYPETKTRSGEALQNFSIEQLTTRSTRRSDVMKKLAQVDFIDRDTLGGHLHFTIAMQHQIFMGIAQAAADKATADFCRKEMAELAAYAKPPAPRIDSVSFSDASLTEYVGMPIKSCGIGLQLPVKAEGDTRLSIALIYMNEGGKNHFEFSGKVFTGEGKGLPVQDLWINFGGADTRLLAQTAQQNTPLLLGLMPTSLAAPVLVALREGTTVAALTSAATGTVKFMPAATSTAEINSFASCIAQVDGSQSEALKAAGFTIDPATIKKISIDPAAMKKGMKQEP